MDYTGERKHKHRPSFNYNIKGRKPRVGYFQGPHTGYPYTDGLGGRGLKEKKCYSLINFYISIFNLVYYVMKPFRILETLVYTKTGLLARW